MTWTYEKEVICENFLKILVLLMVAVMEIFLLLMVAMMEIFFLLMVKIFLLLMGAMMEIFLLLMVAMKIASLIKETAAVVALTAAHFHF